MNHIVLPATHTFIHEWNEPFCLYSVSIHQMAQPPTEVESDCSLLLIYRPRKDERLSWLVRSCLVEGCWHALLSVRTNLQFAVIDSSVRKTRFINQPGVGDCYIDARACGGEWLLIGLCIQRDELIRRPSSSCSRAPLGAVKQRVMSAAARACRPRAVLELMMTVIMMMMMG